MKKNHKRGRERNETKDALGMVYAERERQLERYSRMDDRMRNDYGELRDYAVYILTSNMDYYPKSWSNRRKDDVHKLPYKERLIWALALLTSELEMVNYKEPEPILKKESKKEIKTDKGIWDALHASGDTSSYQVKIVDYGSIGGNSVTWADTGDELPLDEVKM